MGYEERLGEFIEAKTPVISATRCLYQKAQKQGYGGDNIAGVAQLFV